MTSPEGATEALGNSAAVANRHGLGVRRGGKDRRPVGARGFCWPGTWGLRPRLHSVGPSGLDFRTPSVAWHAAADTSP
jgi:hypothetical protein